MQIHVYEKLYTGIFECVGYVANTHIPGIHFGFDLCRACCCMDPQALGRLYWPGPWLTTQSVPSSACLDLNWCKSSLERAPGWCESSSLWPGNSIVLIVSHLFCQTGFNCDKKCQFFFLDKIL